MGECWMNEQMRCVFVAPTPCWEAEWRVIKALRLHRLGLKSQLPYFLAVDFGKVYLPQFLHLENGPFLSTKSLLPRMLWGWDVTPCKVPRTGWRIQWNFKKWEPCPFCTEGGQAVCVPFKAIPIPLSPVPFKKGRSYHQRDFTCLIL